MVSTLRYIFFISLLLLVGCKKNEFSLEFNLEKDVTDNFNVTYYATDTRDGVTVQAVASVREGNCLLKGVTKKPTLVYVTERKSQIPLIIFVDKGSKIEITGKGKDPLAWNVEGNEINQTLTQWREDNLKILTSLDTDSVNGAVNEFVEDNTDNPVSLILMLCYFDRKYNERRYSDLMASLKGIAKENEWLKMVGRSDQLYHTYSYPARLESLIMKSINKEGDTISINHKDPVFLSFWETGYSNRNSLVDSLKLLEKEYPDSVILMADICLDVDSATWRNAIRRDSLENVKRMWAPLGLADSKIMKLKVNGLPYFIVFDSIGQQSYRGQDISEALKEYRNLHSSKDSASSL